MPPSCDGSALLVSLVQITRRFAALRLNTNLLQHAELRKQRKSSARGWRANGATKLDLTPDSPVRTAALREFMLGHQVNLTPFFTPFFG
jgi:hypothetical protein